MDTVQKETHVVSVMTDKYKETCTVVSDEKDDRLLPHQIRRPILTKGEKHLQKHQATERNALQTKGAKFRAVTKIAQNPSCKFWHPPVCQNYKSEKGCIYGKKCFLGHVEAEGKAQQTVKESCVSQDSYPRKSILR